MYRIDELEIRDTTTRPLQVAKGEVLRVATGRVWLTVELGRDDIWLLPGGRVACVKAGASMVVGGADSHTATTRACLAQVRRSLDIARCQVVVSKLS